MSNKISYKWTSGDDKDFLEFYQITEEYYSRIVGGIQNRQKFVPYNASAGIDDVLIAYDADDRAVGCAGFKAYSETDAEIKRVWVQPECRGNGIASEMMHQIEMRAAEKGFRHAILQTRMIMEDAIGLYSKCGYSRIKNYPPYDTLDGAVCFAKSLYNFYGNKEAASVCAINKV